MKLFEDASVLYGFADKQGAGDFPAAHFRVGIGGNTGTYDSLCPFACRTGECDQHRKCEFAENGEGDRTEKQRVSLST